MAASVTPNNTRDRQYKNRDLIEQGKVLIPTKLVITYRFKKFTVAAADGYLAPAPQLAGYGIIRNDAANGTAPANYGEPVLLNQSGTAYGDALFNSELSTSAQTYGPAETTYKTMETSQVIYFNSEYAITNFVAVLHGCEHLARVRNVRLFAKADELGDEQEYILT